MNVPQVHSNGNGIADRHNPDTALNTTAFDETNGGKLIVITAPLTESIDHAGYFIQMGMASMPIWLERVLNSKYPKWREVEINLDGSARYMPAGVRLVEASLLREYKPDDIVCCYPEDIEKFVGPNTASISTFR